MLAREADTAFDAWGFSEGDHYRGQLDGLWAGTKDAEDFFQGIRHEPEYGGGIWRTKKESLGSSHGNGLKGAMGDSFAKGAWEGTAEGLQGFKQKGERARAPSAPEADHSGALEAVVAQLEAHVSVSPFLEVKADQLLTEKSTDVMRAGMAVRGVEDVPSSRFQQSMNDVKMRADIVGVEVLKKLVAEDDIGGACGQVEVVAIIDDQVEVRRDGVGGGALVGDVHTDDTVREAGRSIAQSAVARGELH